MAIVDMTKFRLLTSRTKRKQVLSVLQKFNDVHFEKQTTEETLFKEINTSEETAQLRDQISHLSRVILDLKEVMGIGDKELPMGEMTFEQLMQEGSEKDSRQLLEQIEKLQTDCTNNEQKIQELTVNKDDFMPWQDVSVPLGTLQQLKESTVRLGTVRLASKERLIEGVKELNYAYTQIVFEDRDQAYLAVIYLEEEQEAVEEILKQSGFTPTKMEGKERPKEEIERIDGEIKKLNEKNAAIHEKLKTIGQEHLGELQIEYEYLKNIKSQKEAMAKSINSPHVDVWQGYLPTKEAGSLEKIMEQSFAKDYYLEMEEADRNDPNVPTLLENNAFNRDFQDVTYLYAVPKYNEVDPTPLMAPFYWIFFGMMAGDVAYGLILLGLTIFLMKSKKVMPNNKSMAKFLFILSFSMIIWGFLYGSFLGNFIELPAVLDANRNITELLVLSLIFGLIHLFYGLGVQAYMKIRDGHLKDAIYDVFFWYMTLGGIIVLLAAGSLNIGPTGKTIAKVIMIIGMVGIVLTGGRESKGIGGKIAGGLFSLYDISGYIGDFVSYTRLMALGLSGGFIGLAINLIVEMLWGNIAGKIVGIVVFVGFHAFNIFLSVLSAYVHTSRLTYVEYFGKFYEGGGEAFEGFQPQPEYIRIKD